MISSKVFPQLPLVIVQRRVALVPGAMPVTVVLGPVRLVIVALPDCRLQTPIPTVGVLAAMVKIGLLHCSMSIPASAIVGLAKLFSTTSSKVEPQTIPLLIVQRKVAVEPAATITVVAALEGVSIVAVPEVKVHKPVPGAAAFAAIVKVAVLHWSMSMPAFAIGAGAVLVNTISSKVFPQLPLLIVQRTVALVPGKIPVTVVLATTGLMIVAVPDCRLQTPEPTVGVLAVMVKIGLLHCSMSIPASAIVGLVKLLSTTSSKVEPQTIPLLIVQRNVAVEPAATITVVVALDGVSIVAVPEIKVHKPVPGAAAFAAIVKVAVLHWSMSMPASAIGAGAVLVNTISSKVLPQLPLLIVQRTVTLVPAAMPVTVVLGTNALVIVALPDCRLHIPVPTVGMLAAMVKILVLHCSISTPASAMLGGAVFVKVTSSKVAAQTLPLLIVQRRVTLAPADRPVTPLVFDVGVVITAPLAGPTIVHNPVPGDGAFPDNVKLPVSHCSISDPASATGAGAVLVNTISSKVLAQLPLFTVQRTIALLPATIPVMVVVANAGLVIVAVPDSTLQAPVPIAGAVAAIVKILVLHCSISTPASAMLGVAVLVNVTSSKVAAQTLPLLTVQRRATLAPADRPVTPLVFDVGVVITAPLAGPTIVHNPVPGDGAFPDNVKLPVSHCSISDPASATGAGAVLVNTISSKVSPQLPLLIVQRTVALAPAAMPVTVVVGTNALVIVALPDCRLQTPEPTVGVLATMVKIGLLHCSMSIPASAIVGLVKLLSTTSSKVEPQTIPLLIVQRNVAVEPAATITVVVALDGVSIVAVPEIKVHNPVPGAAAFAAIVKVAVLHWSMSMPASAIGAGAVLVNTISSKVFPQIPLVIVQRTVALVPAAMPVTVVVGTNALVIVALPDCRLHIPAPTVGVLAAMVKIGLLHCSMSIPASAVVGVDSTVTDRISRQVGKKPT